jgi:hypothetical protein
MRSPGMIRLLAGQKKPPPTSSGVYFFSPKGGLGPPVDFRTGGRNWISWLLTDWISLLGFLQIGYLYFGSHRLDMISQDMGFGRISKTGQRFFVLPDTKIDHYGHICKVLTFKSLVAPTMPINAYIHTPNSVFYLSSCTYFYECPPGYDFLCDHGITPAQGARTEPNAGNNFYNSCGRITLFQRPGQPPGAVQRGAPQGYAG